MSKAITDKYKDITTYHSGGGCMHLSLESTVKDVQGNTTDWLINALIDDDGYHYGMDISFDIDDIDEETQCMFGLQIQDVDLNQAQEEVLSSLASNVLMSDSDNFVFIESFKDGYEMMKDIDNRLTNAPTWEDC
jgi:hypothetical protein